MNPIESIRFLPTFAIMNTMKTIRNLASLLLVLFHTVSSFAQNSSLILEGEKHFKSLKQLTFGGDNAEAYFNSDGNLLIFQRTDHKDFKCDQIYMGACSTDPLDTFYYNIISPGEGRTTCSYFVNDSIIMFSSTHLTSDTCPPVPDREKLKKYVWPIYNSYEIFLSDYDGHILKQLTKNNFYDAEATVSPDGKTILFTSDRDGDLDLYTMDLNGKNIKRITNTLGYDGGAFFSPDGTKIVWRASRPKTDEEIKEYKDLLAQGLVAPTNMSLFIANADGSNPKQITNLPRASWAPFFHPSGKKIIFASNYEYERGFPFNLYMINVDGTGLEKITNSNTFDAFPMFSRDGSLLVFCSNRNNGGTHDTNIFLAEWIDNPSNTPTEPEKK